MGPQPFGCFPQILPRHFPKTFQCKECDFYWAQNVHWTITSERNTIVKRMFLRNFLGVVSAKIPSRNLETYCAISGNNTNQAVVVVVFLVPLALESSKHWLIMRSNITTVYPFPLRMFISDLLDFTTEGVNWKFRIHRLKLVDNDVLETFNYLLSVREKFISFVNAFLRETSNLKHGMSIAVRLAMPMESEPLRFSSIFQGLKMLVNSLKTNLCHTLTHWWDDWMCSPLVVHIGPWKHWNSWN